jgi:WD40 repeat protein/serine/threonine protein kinase
MNQENVAADPVGQLAEEFMARYRRGERPPLSEYTERHPELAERIRQLFPMMVMMEEAGSIDEGSRGTTCDASDDDTDRVLRKREQIGGYRLLREVGRGGMGVVYEAEQIALGRHVALKVLPLSVAKEGTSMERFQREAKAAARLHHSNIVPVFEVGQDGDVCYYAMQFIQGQPLDEILDELRRLRQPKKDPLPFTEASQSIARSLLAGSFVDGTETATPAGPPSAKKADTPSSVVSVSLAQIGTQYYRTVAHLGLQVAQALHYAHQENVIHRDIKPSNLLLDTEGRVWITDFGLAKTNGAALTQTGDVVGTIRYMAPERFGGWSDPRSDVYSLGLTLYEMLVLQPAFRAPDKPRMIHQVLHAQPQRPRKLDRHIPRDLETIVLKATDKEPGRRYGNAAELADDLQRFVDDKPIRARRTRAPEHVWRWCKRNRALAGMIAAVIVITVAGFAALVGQMQVARANERIADDAKTKAEERADELAELNEKLRHLNYIADMILAWHALNGSNPNQTRELLDRHRPKRGEADRRGFEWHYLHRSFDNPLWTERAHGGGPYMMVAYTKDSKRLISFGPDEWKRDKLGKLRPGELKMWEVATGRQLPLQLKGGTDKVLAAAVSLDGQRLAAVGSDKDVRVWDIASGELLRTLERPTDDYVQGVGLSPNGNQLLLLTNDSGTGKDVPDLLSAIQVWDLSQRKTVLSIPKLPYHHLPPVFSPDGKHLAACFSDGRFLKIDGSCLKVWEVMTSRELLSIEDVGEGYMSLAYRPDGKLLTLKVGRKIKFWDAVTGKPVEPQLELASARPCLAYSPNGKVLATGGVNGSLELLNASTGRAVRSINGYGSPIFSLVYSPDGTGLASAGIDGTLKIWSTTGKDAAISIPVSRPWLSADGRTVFSNVKNKTIQLYDAVNGKPRGAALEFQPAFRALDVTPDFKRLATTKSNQNVTIWDLDSGKTFRTIQGRTNHITDLAITPDGKFLAISGKEGTFELWDIEKNLEIRSALGQKVNLPNINFSPDGKYLLNSMLRDGRIAIREVSSGRDLWSRQLSDFTILSYCFSPDGTRLALAGFHPNLTGEVHLLDVNSGDEIIAPLKGHALWVNTAAFSPDGKRLATGSTDETIKIWDLTTGQEILTLRGHTAAVGELRFSPDGHRLMSVSIDGTVRVWDATPVAEK